MEDAGRCQKHSREPFQPPDQQEYPPVPLVNVDMFEDKDFLVNRLYYAVPSFSKGHLHCLLYYEENTFRKEKNGSLTLVQSEIVEEGSAPCPPSP